MRRSARTRSSIARRVEISTFGELTRPATAEQSLCGGVRSLPAPGSRFAGSIGGDWLMRPRMGARTLGALAATAALALGVAPGIAAADDDDSLITFRLPNRAAVDQLQAAGTDLGERVQPNADGTVDVDAVVTPEEKAVLEAQGYKAIDVIQGPGHADALRAERNAAIAQDRAALQNAKAGRVVAKVKVKGATATGLVRAQRADYWESYAGRFISIEGFSPDAKYGNCVTNANGQRSCTYQGPTLTASWLDAGGNVLGTQQLSVFNDTDPSLNPWA